MFAKLHITALLTVVLPDLAFAGVVSQRANNICGSKGWDRGNGNYYYSDGNKINTYAACSAKCTADATCKSFGIGEACMLFNVHLDGNFDADSESSDTYYDKACLSSTTSTTLSSSKTTSTSSGKRITSTSAPATLTTTSTSISSKKTTSSVIKVTSSTSNASFTSAAPSSTTPASSAVTVPSGCPAPTAVQLTGLSWFNSTHNLDCPVPNYPPNSQVCWNSDHVCVDETDGVPGGPNVCTCTPFCLVGLPQLAYSPLGYGPPDNISINTDDPAEPGCTAVMPTGFRDFEIGLGHVNCGNAQNTFEFHGDSNKDFGNNGTLYYTGYVYNTWPACQGTPRYGGSFPLSCTRDAGGNATCGLAQGAVTLTLLSLD